MNQTFRAPTAEPSAAALQATLPWPAIGAAVALRWWLFVAALVVSGNRPLVHEPDSTGYLALARSLVNEWKFEQNGEPELYRTPGYPLLLAPGVWLGHPAAYAVIVQGLLGAATVALVWRLALDLNLGESTAGWAAWLHAVEPLSVLYCNKLLAETLFTLLLTAGVLQLIRYGRRPATRAIASSAGFIALSIYVRPVAFYLPALVVPMLLCLAIVQRGGEVRWRHAAVFLAVIVAAVAPWLVRNRVRCDYDQICSTADIKLYFVQARAVQGMQRDGRYPNDINVIDLKAHAALHPEQFDWTRGQRLRWMRAQGAQALREAPGTYAKIHAWEMLDTLCDNGTMAYLNMFGQVPPSSPLQAKQAGPVRRVWTALRTKPVMVLTYFTLTATMLAYLAAAMVGLFSLLRRRTGAPWLPRALLLTVLGYLLVISVGPVGGHRYRVPMMPMLCVLAAAGLQRNVAKRKA